MAKSTFFRAKISKNSKLYYTVHVFKNLSDMREFSAKSCDQSTHSFSKAVGSCTYYSYKEIKPPKTNELGVIVLHEGGLGGDFLAHECTHAALGALDRKGIKNLETGSIGSDSAEELCYIVDYLVSQITKRLYPTSR